MKRALTVIIGTLIVVIGLFFILNSYIQTKTEDDQLPASASSTFSGVISSIDMTAVMVDGPAIVNVTTEDGQTKTIAVPSMGIRTCAAAEHITEVSALAVGDRVEVFGDVTETGQVVPCVSPEHYLRAVSTYEDATVGISFEYRKGPQGYVVTESEMSTSTEAISSLVLMLRDEYNALMAAPDGRELPTAISVSVFENPDSLSPSLWAEEAPEANMALKMGDTREVTVGGANAVRYLIDGLYPTDTVVVAHGGNIYLITGSYLEESDRIRSDFETFLSQFTFIPVVVENDAAAAQVENAQ